MSTLTLAEHQADILASLRRLKGRGTAGDVVAESGLAADDVRAGLKALLESHRGNLAVADSGELLYEFDERLIERGTEPALARFKRSLTSMLTKGFKVWIVVTLVVYFVVFVALVVAAIFAGDRDSRGGLGGRRRGGGGGGHFNLSNFWIWYWIWGSNWRLGDPYYGRRWERTLPKTRKVPFYKKVFAFVFGPDKPKPTLQQLDRSTLRLIRARKGVLTTAELVEHNALPLVEAESEMARLVGAYDGEAAVSPDGELVYAFPGLMASTRGSATSREPNPAWMRLEYPEEFTGNTAGANALVVGMNAFTLAAAATSPWFIFPRLGIGGPAAFAALVIVPVVFSVLFFGVPLLRMVGVGRENRRRRRRNLRRVLLGLVYERSLSGVREIGVDEAYQHLAARLEPGWVKRGDVQKLLHEVAAEFDAEVNPAADGSLRFRFPVLHRQVAAGEVVRRKLDLGGRALGDIVFSTSDNALEADKREMALFDRQLEGGEALDMGRYVPSTDRIAFEDDFEAIAFDEELRQRGLIEA